jgi:hypothetical protein
LAELLSSKSLYRLLIKLKRLHHGLIGIIIIAAIGYSIATLGNTNAAVKVLDTREQNLSFPSTIDAFICGRFDTYTQIQTIHQSSFVSYDNGHSLLTLDLQYQFFDSAGKLVATGTLKNKQLQGEGGLPATISFTNMAQCTGHSETPGKLQKFGSTLTIGEDGLIKQSRTF